MESKVDNARYTFGVAFPYRGTNARNEVRAQDGIALLRLCAYDPSNIAAWREFLSRFVGRIRFFVFKASHSGWAGNSSGLLPGRILDGYDQEDLVQEVLLRLVVNNCQALKRFRGNTEAALSCYLSTIATSVVLDHYKYLSRQRRLQQEDCLQRMDEVLLDRIGINREDVKLERSILVQEIIQIVEDSLREEVAQMETRVRYLLIFKLYLLGGLSLSEISQFDGINLSKKGVDKIITKIIRRLKEKLKAARPVIIETPTIGRPSF